MSCYTDIKHWILVHWFASFCTEVIILCIYAHLCRIGSLLLMFNSAYYRLTWFIYVNLYGETYFESKNVFFHTMILLIKEMIVVFIYVSFAFMYRWFGFVHNNYTITSMNFHQWLVEATFIPLILQSTPFMIISEFFIDHYGLFHVCAVLTKIPLFVLMRYAEIKDDFFVNDMKAYFFHKFCKSPLK